MRVLVQAFLSGLMLSFLAACGGSVKEPVVEDSQPSARGIYLESGEFVEFGSINKHAVDLFDPCQELPMAALEAAGFPAGNGQRAINQVM